MSPNSGKNFANFVMMSTLSPVVKRVIYEQGYPDDFTHEIFGETGVLVEKMEPETAAE